MQIIYSWQNAIYSTLSKLLIGLETGNSQAIALFLSLAFLYGVLHAAGPGHGKAVISSYLLATGDTLKRGLILTAASSFAQGLTAIIFTIISLKIFGLTARSITQSLNILDYFFAAALLFMGLRLLYQSLKSNVNASNCTHIPPAEILAKAHTLKDDVSLILTIAIRPCSGAVLILVFVLTKNLWAIGIAAVFMIALGTFITVAILATIATFMKQWAVRLASQGKSTTAFVWLERAAATFLILMSGLLIFGIWSFERISPFGGLR